MAFTRFARLGAAGAPALLAACLSAGAVPVPEIPESVAPAVIPNYVRVRPDVASGGRPTGEGLARLGPLGFRVVVDLRTPAEGIDAERAAVTAAGLRYVSIPVTAKTLSRDDAAVLAEVLAEEDRGAVLVHCATGNRVGALWALVQLAEGRPYEEALAAGRTLGLRSPEMLDAVRRVAGRDPAVH